MFYQKKNSNKYHNYILVSEKDSGIKQYHFSKKKVLGFFVLSVVVLSSVLFLSANFLSNFIYKNKISNLRSNYENLTNTIISLEKELDELTTEMTGIEDKDKAIRTYAGLPQIDNDIRKLGVGGGTIIGNSSYKNIPNDLDGEDVSDMWLGLTRKRTKPLLWGPREPGLTIREDQWKYYLLFDERNQYYGEALYDVVNDPGEKSNLVESYPEIASKLKAKLMEFYEELPKKIIKTGNYKHQY